MTERKSINAEVKGRAWQGAELGEGPPVLILHGADGAAAWESVQQRLGQTYRCILPVHPGFDDEALPTWLDHPADLANAYLEIIETLNWGPVHLVGYELGGWIAAEMAVRNSGALASLTLVSAQGIHVPDVPRVDVFLRTDEQLAKDTFYDATLADQAIKEIADPTIAERLIRNKEVAARLTWQPRGYDLNLQKWLHRVSVPTKIVWGENDTILPVTYAHAWQRHIPDALLSTIAACGHAPHIEQPAALAQEVDQLVKHSRNAA